MSSLRHMRGARVRAPRRFPYHRRMRRPLRLLVPLGVVAVAVLAAIAVLPRRAPPPRPAAPAAGAVDTGGDVVARALDLARGDSVRLRELWVDDVPDLDLAALSSGPRAIFLRIANGRRCDCGCGYTLAGCRRFDPTCPVSGPRAQALLDSVRDGRIAHADGFTQPPAGR